MRRLAWPPVPVAPPFSLIRTVFPFPFPVRLPVAALLALVLGACSGDTPSTEQIDRAVPLVVELAAAAEVDLSTDHAVCVVDELGAKKTRQVLDQGDDPLPPDVVERLATSIVRCVGAEPLARSALEPIIENASETSVDCAVDRVDGDLLTRLIAADLGSGLSGELEVKSVVVEAVAFCFEPVELLNLGD